jgi:hypothetical protein
MSGADRSLVTAANGRSANTLVCGRLPGKIVSVSTAMSFWLVPTRVEKSMGMIMRGCLRILRLVFGFYARYVQTSTVTVVSKSPACGSLLVADRTGAPGLL